MNDATVPHVPVLLNETLELLRLRPGDGAVDGTAGAGGHAEALLRAVAPGGRLLALDADPAAVALAGQRLAPLAAELQVRCELVHANFRDLAEVLKAHGLPPPRAILADLGVSSMQLDVAARGFSFSRDGPLDLRMDPGLPETGADLLRRLPERKLADLIYQFGDERGSRAIARHVVEARERGEPVETTAQLARLVCRALRVREHRRIHPATRCFQALRMAVNRELDALRALLAVAPELLAPDGALAVLAFHSGEDRLVKHSFKEWAGTGRFQIVGRHVARPGWEECRRNPRARSARLRVLRNVSGATL